MDLLNHHPMNSTMSINRSKPTNGPKKWLGICGLSILMLVQASQATDAIWPPADQMGQVFNYTVPGNPPPTIDATAFDNENEFTINFSVITANPEIYETWNTINYTNNGLMVANSPVSTNGILLQIAPGCGFLFDTQTTNVISKRMAGSFYNTGDIRANSVLDTDANFFSLFTVGKITAWATNIVNPGTVTVGQNGLLQLTGQNVDLTRGQLYVENLNTLENVLTNVFTGFTFFIPLNLSALAASVGHETNYINPAAQFSLPNPSSDAFLPPLFMALKNATAYVDDTGVIGLNRMVRAVFISNPVASVTNNVYFNNGFGDILVEWSGTYLNPATGVQATNHMYLEDDFGVITNLQVSVGGGPVNYLWLSQWPFLLGAAAPQGLPPGTFDNNFITNEYAFESVQLIATTVATNKSLANPSGAFTNLPGRIQINASRDLDLSLAQISGPNYMALTATNHFEGSSGASIFAPFSDISLAVTNGSLSVSNLLQPSIPNWNGPAQVFSARWQTVDAFGVTNAYHVLLVNSQLLPTTVPIVQDLTLHSTNLFISDSFNLIRKLYIDATSLTVTTNLNTDGFGSQSGELNWNSTVTLNSVQFPNLRWLTNNGAIRAGNLTVFGSSSSPYGAIINNSLISNQGLTVFADNFLSSGTISNGTGAFALQSATTTLTNGFLIAGGTVSITTGNLLTSNLVLSAGKSLTLSTTNELTDTGPTNGNLWIVGANSTGSGGFNLPIKPVLGDLLGTTVTNNAPLSKNVINTWAGEDRGATVAGYKNNVALGRLILDARGTANATLFTFNGATVANAIYVDYLELRDSATNRDVNGNVPSLAINNNLVIYYAQAVMNGVSVAAKLDHKNNDHLRWVPAYHGYFSSTNLVYPDGTTNAFNAALAQSTTIDSDGDGVPNASDNTPFFVPSEVALALTVTNIPPLTARITWHSIPGATNYVYYTTTMGSTNWIGLTNFVSPSIVPPVGGWPITNIVFDPIQPQPRYYNVKVCPNKILVYGQ